MKKIDTFEHDYYFLSNFFKCNFKIGGYEFPTVEHYFQAKKSKNFEQDIIDFFYLPCPSEAKKLGRQIELRNDWEYIKDGIMFKGVFQKFKQNEHLKNKLISTKNYELIEGNFWHDNYWGNCTCQRCVNIDGKNKLGNILMIVRSLLIMFTKV